MTFDDHILSKAMAHATEVLDGVVFETEEQAENAFESVVDDYISGAMEIYENHLTYGFIKATAN